MLSIIADRSIIKISGMDAAKFLQNLMTNDVDLAQEKAIYAMMLSPQGRFLFDMFIIKVKDTYLLDIFTHTKDLMLKKLRMYKINMQVEIEDAHKMRVGYLSLASGDVPVIEGMQCYKDSRHDALGYRVIVGLSHQVDPYVISYIQDKYKYAIPDGGIDLLYDKAMPQEYGAEQLHAISYTKGCYIGQEVISRTKSQGVVRKKIYKISADFDMSNIPHGTEIIINGTKTGIFCSGYMQEGIALIREGDLFFSTDNSLCTLNGHHISLARAIWY